MWLISAMIQTSGFGRRPPTTSSPVPETCVVPWHDQSSMAQPNVLYLTHRFPYPPDKGDRIRNYNVLRFVAGGARVSLGTLADEPVPESWRDAVRGICERMAVF